jgi:hypothetical protein
LILQLQKKTEGVKKKFFTRKIFPFSPVSGMQRYKKPWLLLSLYSKLQVVGCAQKSDNQKIRFVLRMAVPAIFA